MNGAYGEYQLDAKHRLDGKVAIVTGAGRGLGREIAVALAGAGASVTLVARSATQLEETAAMITESRGKSLTLPLDVTVAGTAEYGMRAMQDRQGGCSRCCRRCRGHPAIPPTQCGGVG